MYFYTVMPVRHWNQPTVITCVEAIKTQENPVRLSLLSGNFHSWSLARRRGEREPSLWKSYWIDQNEAWLQWRPLRPWTRGAKSSGKKIGRSAKSMQRCVIGSGTYRFRPRRRLRQHETIELLIPFLCFRLPLLLVWFFVFFSSSPRLPWLRYHMQIRSTCSGVFFMCSRDRVVEGKLSEKKRPSTDFVLTKREFFFGKKERNENKIRRKKSALDRAAIDKRRPPTYCRRYFVFGAAPSARRWSTIGRPVVHHRPQL